MARKKVKKTGNKKKVNTKKDAEEVEYLGEVEPQPNEEEEHQPNEDEEPEATEEKEPDANEGKEPEAIEEEEHEAIEEEEPEQNEKVLDDDAMETHHDDGERLEEDEPQGEVEFTEHPDQPKRKKHRGPTKMKHIAKDPNSRVRVDFTDMGEPVGPGSVLLSSYLGPLVREHVPVTIDDWRKITEEVKTILWKSVQARFEIDEEYQKNVVMKQMGCLWRASKSRIVSQIRDVATTNQERMNMRPKNISPSEWRKFVKLKTSSEFKAVSDSYKERRSLQIPHTCSRKGMVRLADDMKKSSEEPSEVTRLKVWVKSRTKKDGTPVNTKAAEKFRKAAELIDTDTSNSTNPREDHLTQLLGPDNPGRMRAMGRSMSMTKLACFQVKKHFMAQMKESQFQLMNKVSELEGELAEMKKQRQEPEVGENSADARSVKSKTGPKCVLVDWCDTDDNVAEGRIVSTDPKDFVNEIPLGPLAVKVLVEFAIKTDAFLWRPAPEMYSIEQAVGEMIAWPASKCITADHGLQPEDIPLKSPTTDSVNKCTLLDWAQSDDVVAAEGRWQCQEPTTLVNGLPLGPNAVKVFVDVVHEPETFLWRPTSDKPYLGQSLKSFVAWPTRKCVFENTAGTSQRSATQNHTPSDKAETAKSTAQDSDYASPSSKSPLQKSPASCSKAQVVLKKKPPPKSPLRRSQRHGSIEVAKENQKCRLMDISGKKIVVAEGRWASDNPEQTVHFVPLGPNGVRVWIDVVKVKNAAVWRSSSEIECMGDAIGTSIAWPKDKVILC